MPHIYTHTHTHSEFSAKTDCVVELAQDASCLGKQTVVLKACEKISTIHFFLGMRLGYLTYKVSYYRDAFPS